MISAYSLPYSSLDNFLKKSIKSQILISWQWVTTVKKDIDLYSVIELQLSSFTFRKVISGFIYWSSYKQSINIKYLTLTFTILLCFTVLKFVSFYCSSTYRNRSSVPPTPDSLRGNYIEDYVPMQPGDRSSTPSTPERFGKLADGY